MRSSRRIFLRGLGGAVVAAPFLSSLGGRGVKAEPVTFPKRLVAMFTHYGCITNRFFPKKSHGALTAADLQATTLKHLVPYVDKLLIPRGIRAMNEWNAKMSRGQGNDQHTQVVGSYLTCQPVTPNSNDPFSFDQATKFNAKPVGPSLDHVITQSLGVDGVPLYLRVGNLGESPQSAISYSAAETLFPGFGAWGQALSNVTGLFKEGAVSPDTYRAVRGKSVIDLVKDDLDTLERFDMSASDRRKLEAWKELLNGTTMAVAATACNQDVAMTLGATQKNVDAAAAAPKGDPLMVDINGTLDGADLYSSIAVLAAVCNATPVVILKYPASYVFKGLGINTESASLAHRLDNAGMSGVCVDNAISMLASIDDYYARKFAHVLSLLQSVEEGDGTLLDNCAAVWLQEMSDGAAGNLNNLPIVQAGSAGGYFKTGWTVNVEDGSPTLTPGNSEFYCGAGGDGKVDGITQNTGTDPKLANAPINKYYCNLMNALGVKAGKDGFPAKNGSAPVTHFGMYDKTEDFIGGGTNPPTIHDPGEFSSLRA